MGKDVDLHRHHSPEKLKIIARALYVDQKYDEALEVLNAVLRVKEDDLTLLDMRAGTYEKLDQPKMALVDGQRMLRVDKKLANGYLRTAKILQKMDQSSVALKIYERGLSHVPLTDGNYELLRDLRNKLSKVLAPPKSVDFLTILPIEVIEMIFYYTQFRQICRCLRVCRHWRKFLTSWPLFWRDVDLSTVPTGRFVRTKAMFDYITWSKLEVRRASIKGLDLQGTQLLRQLAVKCKNLHTLKILSGGQLRQSLLDATQRANSLRNLSVGCSVTVDASILHHIMNTAGNLENVRFDAIHWPWETKIDNSWGTGDQQNLHVFSVMLTKDSFHRIDLEALCPPATRLTSLMFKGVSDKGTELALDYLPETRPCLEVLSLQDIVLCHPSNPLHRFSRYSEKLPLPTCMRKLTLINTRALGLTPCTTIDHTSDLPHLTEMCLRERCYGYDIEAWKLSQILDCEEALSTKPLAKLDMSMARFEYGEVQETLALSRLKCLQHLRLTNCHLLDDFIASVIAKTMKDLVHLALPGSKVTGVSVKALVQALPDLARLDLNECQSISADAIDWARRQGVKVGHQLTP